MNFSLSFYFLDLIFKFLRLPTVLSMLFVITLGVHRYKPNCFRFKHYFSGMTLLSWRPDMLRCRAMPSIWTLGHHQPVIPRVAFIRCLRPSYEELHISKLTHNITAGSLSSAFASARLVSLAVKPAYAFTRPVRFPSGLS